MTKALPVPQRHRCVEEEVSLAKYRASPLGTRTIYLFSDSILDVTTNREALLVGVVVIDIYISKIIINNKRKFKDSFIKKFCIPYIRNHRFLRFFYLE